MNAEWLEQRQVIVDHVMVPHPTRHKFIVCALADGGASFDSIGADALFGSGEIGEEGGPSVSGEIDAGVKSDSRDGEKHCQVGRAACHHITPVDIGKRRENACASA